MTINFKRVAEKIYDALQASGYEEIQTFDVNGNRIYGIEIKDANDNPVLAKKFYIPDDKIMVSINERGEEDSEVNVKLGPNVNIKEFSRVLGDKLRTISYREGGLSYNVRSWGKELEPKDFAHSLKMREVKDMKVEEGKVNWTGTTRSSYSRIGECRIIVRHSDRVNEDKFGSRTRNIESVFVETPSGERFRIPENNIHGARALARHITNGGSINDSIGNRIVEMIEKMTKLREVYNEARKASKDSMISEQANELAVNIRENYIRIRESLRKMSGKIGYVRETEDFEEISETKNEKIEKKSEKEDIKKPNMEFDRPLEGKDRFKRDAENLFSVNESRKTLPEITLLENELTKLSEVEFFTESDFLDEEVISEKTNPESALHNLNMYVGHPLFNHYLSIYENQGIVDEVLSLVEVNTKLWNAILENRESISEFQTSTVSDMNDALQKVEMLMNQNNMSADEAIRQVAEEMAPMMGGTETVESLEQQIYSAAEEKGLIAHDTGSTFVDDVLASDDTIEAHKAEINAEEYFGDSKFAESEEVDESLETEQISRIRQLAGIKKVSEEDLTEYSSKMKYEVSDEEFDRVANSPETKDEFRKLSTEMDKALLLKAKEIRKASGGDEKSEEKMWRELGDEAGVVSSILQNYGFSKIVADAHGHAYVRSLKDGNSGWVFDNAAILKILNRVTEADESQRLNSGTNEEISESSPKYFQDGADFYDAEKDLHIATAPFPVKDFDMNAAVEAEKWFNANFPEYEVASDPDLYIRDREDDHEPYGDDLGDDMRDVRPYGVDLSNDLDDDMIDNESLRTEQMNRLQQLAGIKEYNTWGSPKVADPHGGAMISPYGNELDDSEVDVMYDNVKSVVDDELKMYSDVLASKQIFLQHYDMADIDDLASEIASDAIAKAANHYSDLGDEDLYHDNVDYKDITAYVKSKFMAALGESAIEEGDPFNRHKKDLRDRDRTLIRPEDKLNAGGKFSFEEGFKNSYVDSEEFGVNPEHVYTRWHDLRFNADKNDPRWVEKLRQQIADEYGITSELVRRITHGDINSRMMGIEEASPLYHGDGYPDEETIKNRIRVKKREKELGDAGDNIVDLEKTRPVDIRKKKVVDSETNETEMNEARPKVSTDWKMYGDVVGGATKKKPQPNKPVYVGQYMGKEKETGDGTMAHPYKVGKFDIFHAYPDEITRNDIDEAGYFVYDTETDDILGPFGSEQHAFEVAKLKQSEIGEAKERADWTYGREETMMKRLDRTGYGERGADKQGSKKREPEDKYAQMAKKYSSKMKKEDINSELSEEARRIIQLARHK